MAKTSVFKNTAMLYIMTFARLIFPLITLPYLARILSEESYGFVSYVKSCMTYIQLVVDFGFILSSVKDIVKLNGDKDEIGKVVGNTFLSKIMLSVIAFIVLIFMVAVIEILKLNVIFVLLSFIGVATTAFLADFLFRGIEKMEYITFIYLIAKGVSVILTFILVKNDGDLIWIPVLDIVTNVISIIITLIIINKLGIKIKISNIFDCFKMIKDSFVYFLSGVASTVFAALNTLLIGIFIKDLTIVAYWSMCLTIITAIQSLYGPITNSIYPHMIKERKLAFIHKTLMIFMPIVLVGSIISVYFSEFALLVVGGEKYIPASNLFKLMVPILFFSFPAQVYGWPTLGAIGRVKETTFSTIISAVFQVVGIIVLAYLNLFNVYALALLRGATELILLLIRMVIVYKNKREFASADAKVKTE
ncbi:MAG: oligosaccharide flippase family protein [Clostridia bacterium]|nr:oligosaccharide flippase family protein [Clostridia bacterium]